MQMKNLLAVNCRFGRIRGGGFSLNYQQITPHVWKENKVHTFLQQVFSNYCVLVHHIMKHLNII